MTTLTPEFLTRALAHRGLHDLAAGAPENSLTAFRRAMDQSYGIECDVQLSADGEAMVFHDYSLERLTAEVGPVRERTAAQLGAITLAGGSEAIPTLGEVLDLVAGQTPLLIEIKDQDGALGPDTGALEAACARVLADYGGTVAAMSFNPHAMIALRKDCPWLALGLVTCDFVKQNEWFAVPIDRRRALRDMRDLARFDASFISHDRHNLASAPVARIKARGLPVLCWTVRSRSQEREARKVADNITFEGYLA
ncbi:MAG: glycerophosphodiester phosphodiesterase family protein [Paracoccaceae bacterium]